MMRGAGLRARAATVVAVAVAIFVAAPGWARAGGEDHRVAVVVDLGDEVKTARVTFEGEAITGVEALQLAGFDPVARAYDGRGGAVCSVCDRGCPPDSTCLTCGGASYWAYFRAASGAMSYTYSPVGAGATQVHDGDVEAWKWGPGTAPRFISFAEVWGESIPTAPTTLPATPPPTTRPAAATTATSAPVSATTPTVGGPATSATAGVATAAVVPPATARGEPGAAAASSSGTSVATDPPGTSVATDPGSPVGGAAADTEAARGGRARGGGAVPSGAEGSGVAAGPVAPPVDGGKGGTPAGLLGFAAVVGGLTVWILRSRSSRGHHGDFGSSPPSTYS